MLVYLLDFYERCILFPLALFLYFNLKKKNPKLENPVLFLPSSNASLERKVPVGGEMSFVYRQKLALHLIEEACGGLVRDVAAIICEIGT